MGFKQVTGLLKTPKLLNYWAGLFYWALVSLLNIIFKFNVYLFGLALNDYFNFMSKGSGNRAVHIHSNINWVEDFDLNYY